METRMRLRHALTLIGIGILLGIFWGFLGCAIASAQEVQVSAQAGWDDSAPLGFEPGPWVGGDLIIADSRTQRLQGRLKGAFAWTPKAYTGTGEGTAWGAGLELRGWLRSGLGGVAGYRWSGWDATDHRGRPVSKEGGTASAGLAWRWAPTSWVGAQVFDGGWLAEVRVQPRRLVLTGEALTLDDFGTSFRVGLGWSWGR